MKKKLLVVTMAVVMALGVLALSACGGTTLKSSATVTYGEVGVENHSYFPYAIVTVDSKGKATDVEIGEAFGPTGKFMMATGTPTYRNPWYPGIGKISTAIDNAKDDGENPITLTLAQKKAIVDDKYYISIAGKVFKLTVVNITSGSIRQDVLVFVGKDDATLQLTDRYIADNMKWYIDAVKAGTAFICNASGTKLEATADITLPDATTVKATFADGAIRKNDTSSTYYPARGLDGEYFVKAMNELAAFAKEKNFAIEYESKTGGNYQGLRIKGLTLSVQTDETKITTATSRSADTFLNYAASYMKVAEKAFALAKASLF